MISYGAAALTRDASLPSTGVSVTGAVARSKSASGRIVTVLPRGEAIRNFVHTGTLDTVQSVAELAVITVVPNAGVLSQLRDKYECVLPLEDYDERYLVRILRGILDMAHGRRLWSAAAQERWRLRDVEATTPMRKLKHWGRKVACYPFVSRSGLAALERAERAASRALCPTTSYQALYRELRPSLVFNTSHVHSRNAIQAIQAAQWLGIPTAAFIFSWDNLTSQGRILPAYDYYLVWNEDLKRQLLQIYPRIAPERVFVTGTPQFDFHFRPDLYWSREEFCAKVRADPKRPIVLYSTGMPGHMPGEPLIVEQIADMLTGIEGGSPQLLVRVYPKDRTGRFNELKRRRADILFPEVNWVESWLTPTDDDNQMLTNTLRHVDAGINVASTISLELCMFDKPVVNVAYNPPGIPSVRVPYARYYEYDHYKPLVVSGAVQLACTPADMRAMLGEVLSNPGARSNERLSLIAQMFGATLDGCSHKRVADVLLKLAGQTVRDDA
jgi:hypothetical protein